MAEATVTMRQPEPEPPTQQKDPLSNVEELLKGVQTNQLQLAEQTVMAKLMADPDLRQVLLLKQQGKQVKFQDPDSQVSQVQKPEEVKPPTDSEVNAMTQAELAQYIVKTTTAALAPLAQQSADSLKPKLQQLEAIAQNTEAERVKSQIAGARKKYSDFDQYGQVMMQINNSLGGQLDAEELYILAKKRSGTLPQAAPSGVASERPSGSSARPPAKQTRQQALPSGTAGFRQLVGEALANLEIKLEE